MSILLDTGLLAAFYNSQDEHHLRAKEILREVVEGRHGTAYTSDYIFDEAVTLTLARTGRADIAVNLGRLILEGVTRPFIVMLKVGDDGFSEAWNLFIKHAERRLSFTDCSSLSLLALRHIEKIGSFDAGFDGLANRIS